MQLVSSKPPPASIDYRSAPLRAPSNFTARKAFAVTFVHFALLVAAMISLTPFVWLLCATFKTGDDLFAYMFLPWYDLRRLTTENFAALFRKEAFSRWLLNSLFLASTQTAIV